MGEAAPPQDRIFDRRVFLERMGALTAAAATGSAFVPGVVSAYAAVPAFGRTLADRGLPDLRSIQTTDPWEMTVAELAALLRDGALGPAEVVEGYLRRIEIMDGTLQAFNTVGADEARADAARLGATPWSGPLHGIPLAMKDNFFTRGMPTTANSHLFRDFVPGYDATAWARLRESGAILLGKTQMGPLATTRATTPDGVVTTRSAWAPHDPSVDPGGSSSGSATAVAARMAAGATGTQTGGSITNPAARQGLTGLKPTMGRVSLHGIIPLSYTRDHPGPLARDAMDAALLLQTMAGPDPADPRTLGLPPVPDLVASATPVRRGSRTVLRWPTRLGIFPGEMDAPRRAMVSTFEALGATIVEVEPPEEWGLLTGGAFNNVRLVERAEPFLEHLRGDVRLFGTALSPWINGLLLSGPEYLRGQRAKMVLLRRVLEGIFHRCDAVVMNSHIPFDMIGLPLVAFPIGFDASRGYPLPLSGMLGGLPFGEERLLSLVAAYQAETDWHRRRPADPVPAGATGEERGGAPPLRLDVLDVAEACQ